MSGFMKPLKRTFWLQEMPSALKRSFLTWIFLIFFILMDPCGLLDPNPDFGSTDPTESGSGTKH
jgi:hypothetical protein